MVKDNIKDDKSVKRKVSRVVSDLKAADETGEVPVGAEPKDLEITPESSAPAKKERPAGQRKPSLAGGVGESGLIERVVAINRVAKATKGGTRLAFSALVVVGDTKGKVGYSLGKAGEVAQAIKKALNGAKKSMVKVPMRGTTITHEVLGQWGGARVLLKPASEGTGIIAAGPVRAICDGAGISNVLTKCHRSNNPVNVIKATFEGLSRLKSLEDEE